MNYAETPTPRPRVAVTEVGTRDGFQSEAAFIPTADKAGVIDALIGAGVTHVEATSFASPIPRVLWKCSATRICGNRPPMA